MADRIEETAKAIHNAILEGAGSATDWDTTLPEEVKPIYRNAARAAETVLREEPRWTLKENNRAIIEQRLGWLAAHTEGEARASVEIISSHFGFGHAADLSSPLHQEEPSSKYISENMPHATFKCMSCGSQQWPQCPECHAMMVKDEAFKYSLPNVLRIAQAYVFAPEQQLQEFLNRALATIWNRLENGEPESAPSGVVEREDVNEELIRKIVQSWFGEGQTVTLVGDKHRAMALGALRVILEARDAEWEKAVIAELREGSCKFGPTAAEVFAQCVRKRLLAHPQADKTAHPATEKTRPWEESTCKNCGKPIWRTTDQHSKGWLHKDQLPGYDCVRPQTHAEPFG